MERRDGVGLLSQSPVGSYQLGPDASGPVGVRVQFAGGEAIAQSSFELAHGKFRLTAGEVSVPSGGVHIDLECPFQVSEEAAEIAGDTRHQSQLEVGSWVIGLRFDEAAGSGERTVDVSVGELGRGQARQRRVELRIEF